MNRLYFPNTIARPFEKTPLELVPYHQSVEKVFDLARARFYRNWQKDLR